MKLEIALKLEENLYLEDKVKVILLKEHNDLFDGEGFLRLGKGMEVELPRWLAKELVDAGIAKYVREKTVDDVLKEVSKFVFLESRKDEPYPVELPADFYKRVKEILEKFKNPDVGGEDVEKMAYKLLKVSKIKNYVKEIINLRLKKIVQKILDEDEIPVALEEKLTPEEKVFAYEFLDDTRTWKKGLTGE